MSEHKEFNLYKNWLGYCFQVWDDEVIVIELLWDDDHWKFNRNSEQAFSLKRARKEWERLVAQGYSTKKLYG